MSQAMSKYHSYLSLSPKRHCCIRQNRHPISLSVMKLLLPFPFHLSFYQICSFRCTLLDSQLYMWMHVSNSLKWPLVFPDAVLQLSEYIYNLSFSYFLSKLFFPLLVFSHWFTDTVCTRTCSYPFKFALGTMLFMCGLHRCTQTTALRKHDE